MNSEDRARNDDDHVVPTRRTLLRAGGTAAWTVPVIVAATAAPAFSVSAPGIFTVSAGTTFVHASEYYKAVIFQGFTIVPSKAIPAGTLRLTITFSGIRARQRHHEPLGRRRPADGLEPVDGRDARLRQPDSPLPAGGGVGAGETVSFPNNTRGGVPNSSGYYVDAERSLQRDLHLHSVCDRVHVVRGHAGRPGRAWRGRRRAAPAFVLTPAHS